MVLQVWCKGVEVEIGINDWDVVSYSWESVEVKVFASVI